LYSGCSYLFEAVQFFQESMPMLIASDTSVEDQKEALTRLQNTFHGALHLLVWRLNTIELLTAVDSDSVAEEDEIRMRANIKQLEMEATGFSFGVKKYRGWLSCNLGTAP
jgi:hypothetical protein